MVRSDRDMDRRQMRLAASVIAIAFLLWFAGSALGGLLGLPVRYALLLDLACLASLVWALAVLFRVWRRRDQNGA